MNSKINVNYVIQLIIMYENWFIHFKKQTTLVNIFNNRENCERGGEYIEFTLVFRFSANKPKALSEKSIH